MLWLDQYIRPRRRFAPSRFGQARNLSSFIFLALSVIGYGISAYVLVKLGFSSTLIWFGVLGLWIGLGALGYFVLGERSPKVGESWGSLADLTLARLGVGYQAEGERVRYFYGQREADRPPERTIKMLPTAVRLTRPLADGEDLEPTVIAGVSR